MAREVAECHLSMVPFCFQDIHRKADPVLEIVAKRPVSKVIDAPLSRTSVRRDDYRVHHAAHEGLHSVSRSVAVEGVFSSTAERTAPIAEIVCDVSSIWGSPAKYQLCIDRSIDARRPAAA